ncbi:MAG TPA: hypothetical protein VE964_00515 [Myxococcales bacterium]|nr:hypothetical protein [Myxococcales bacterium]
MLPVPGGTLKLTAFPRFLMPNDWDASAGMLAVAARAGSHAGGGFVGGTVPPSTTVGVPGGVHAGEPPGDRQAPFTQPDKAPVHVPHAGKQNEPVDVLTHLPFAGQLLWSLGLQAAVHTPPGNSGLGSVPQISPCAHVPQATPRSALAGRDWGGQFAAGMQAPKLWQQVYPLRQSDAEVQDLAQIIPLPLARRSAQTAPVGHGSPAQV